MPSFFYSWKFLIKIADSIVSLEGNGQMDIDFDSDYDEPEFIKNPNMGDVQQSQTDGFSKSIPPKDNFTLEDTLKETSIHIDNDDKDKIINIEKITYKRHQCVGYFIIWCHRVFNPRNCYLGTEIPLSRRDGAEQDAIMLREAMQKLGYRVFVYVDYTKKEVENVLNKLTNKVDMTHCSTFGMAISSHGDSNGVIYVNDGYIMVNDYINKIKEKKSLGMKPKVRTIATISYD